MGRIAILSHVVTDEIYRSGRFRKAQIGGAGAYAAVGAALVAQCSQPILVAGTGREDLPRLTQWTAERGIDPAGLFVVGERGPITQIRYEDDANRVEVPVFGLEHFIEHTPLPRHVPALDEQLQGVYLFHNSEEPYWGEIARYRRSIEGIVLWEVAADCCVPELLDEVRSRAQLVDAVTLNLSEATALLSLDEPSAALAAAAGLAPLVLVHDGTKGSWVLSRGATTWVGVRSVVARDVTGGGNSYAGALLQALVDGEQEVSAARLAASAAAEVVRTVGVPLVTDQLRETVRLGAGRVPTREV